MTIQVGDTIPDAKLKNLASGGMREISVRELCAGKKVVLFGVPGAFTPTCSDAHLPGFMEHAAEIRARGVDTVACVSVNDAFVMAAWAKERTVGDEILMLADGNGEFSRALGLELDLSGFGMGRRSRRYAAILEDGRVDYLGVEAGPEVGVSSARAVLEAL